MAEDSDVRFLLVPGGGGSGPDHWHHRWAESLQRCAWVHQQDPDGGSIDDWVTTIDRAINASSDPVIVIAHSLACVAVAHWAMQYDGPVAAALLVAPADIDDDWAEPDSLYKRFQPIPLDPLPFPSTVVASTDDPLLSLDRARTFAAAWGSEIEIAGAHLHIGSDALLDTWPAGRSYLDDLERRAVSDR